MADYSFDDIIDKYSQRCSVWQFGLIGTLIWNMTIFFTILGQLAFLVPDYRCDQPRFNTFNWSNEEIINFSIPFKSNRQAPPRVGQAHEPCLEYNLDSVLPSLNQSIGFDEALALRNHLLPNLTTRSCSAGIKFDRDTAHIQRTAGEDWEIVCSRSKYASHANFVYVLGFGIGVIISGPLSDNFGRRPVILFSGLITIVAIIATSFVQGIWPFIILRFFTAAANNICFVTCHILISECFSVQGRNLFTPGRKIFIGLVIRPYQVLAMYLLQDWRWGNLAFCAPLLLLIFGIYTVTESPRWLLAQGRVDEACAITSRLFTPFSQAADPHLVEQLKTDMKLLYRQCTQTTQSKIEDPSTSDETEERKPSIRNTAKGCIYLRSECKRLLFLLRDSKLRRIFLCLVTLFVLQTFIYFGVSFYTVRLDGNPFLIIFINGLIMIPSSFVQYIAYRCFDRRKPIIAAYSAASVCLGISCVFVALGNRGAPVIALATTAHLFTNCLFTMMYIYFPELLPATHRATGFGFASAFGRVGMAAAMYAERLDEYVWAPLPMLLFTIASVIAAIVSSMLPDSKGTMKDFGTSRSTTDNDTVRQPCEDEATEMNAMLFREHETTPVVEKDYKANN